MKMKSLIASAFGLLLLGAHADVKTYQGSSRWNTTFFRTNTKTAAGSTSYISYTLIEYSGSTIVGAVKIDAWTARNPVTRVTERNFYVDRDFSVEMGYFGIGGSNPAGGMEFGGIASPSPFRGTLRYGNLDAFSLYHTSDYYPIANGLDVTEITGSGRFNAYFSGNVALTTAEDAVAIYLEGRGYREVF